MVLQTFTEPAALWDQDMFGGAQLPHPSLQPLKTKQWAPAGWQQKPTEFLGNFSKVHTGPLGLCPCLSRSTLGDTAISPTLLAKEEFLSVFCRSDCSYPWKLSVLLCHFPWAAKSVMQMADH